MSPRLTRLSVENFRSIRGRIDVDLDAPVILVHGANGSGKTSLLLALELGLTGNVNSLQRSKTEDVNDLIHVGADNVHSRGKKSGTCCRYKLAKVEHRWCNSARLVSTR